MAETQFEDDLRMMFERAPPAPDAAAFAQQVDARIVRRGWLRAGLVSALGAAGVAIAWFSFGLSPSDFHVAVPTIQSVTQSVAGPDNLGLWAAGILVLTLGLAGYQLATAEV
jgi:hypothetical protein